MTNILDDLVNGHTRNTRHVLGNLGLTVNVSNLPEYQAYQAFYVNRSPMMRFLLRTFLKRKIAAYKQDAQVAVIRRVIKQIEEEIQDGQHSTDL